MKDEREVMEEFLKNHTNAKNEFFRKKRIDKVTKGITISLSTLIIIVSIIMLFFIGIYVYSKTYLIFTMNKKQFIKKLEDTYNQKIEIIQDSSSPKGNGTFVMKTKKEPQIEFYAEKDNHDGYRLDYEDRALIYYKENNREELFEDLVFKTSMEKSNKYDNFDYISCYDIGIKIDNYLQIEEASKQIYNLTQYLNEKLGTFNKKIHLKIGEYTSWVDYGQVNSVQEAICCEKYAYYWYLKNNGKDTSIIPNTDVQQVNKPDILDVYVNGQKIKNAEINEYLTVKYDILAREYEIEIRNLVLNCDRFEYYSGNKNAEMEFIYSGKKYEIHYKDKILRGNKLPYLCKISYLEQLLDAKIEYDYENKKINIIL